MHSGNAHTEPPHLSPWKGGGFGMFSTTDDAGRRRVRVFVSAPDRSEEIAISPSLEDAARARRCCRQTTSLTRLAHRVVERERRYARPVDTVRIEAWRIDYDRETLAATSHLLREFVYRVDRLLRPSRDEAASPTSSSR